MKESQKKQQTAERDLQKPDIGIISMDFRTANNDKKNIDREQQNTKDWGMKLQQICK